MAHNNVKEWKVILYLLEQQICFWNPKFHHNIWEIARYCTQQLSFVLNGLLCSLPEHLSWIARSCRRVKVNARYAQVGEY